MPKGKYKLFCRESLVQKGSFTEKEIITDWMVWAKIPVQKAKSKTKNTYWEAIVDPSDGLITRSLNRIYRKNRDESEQIEFI